MSQQWLKRHETPYIQGDFDGLCGLYAVINAACMSSSIKRKHCQHIFLESLTELSAQRDVAEVVYGGMSRACLSRALKVAATTASVQWCWPFYRRKQVSLATVWRTVQQFVNAKPGNVAILMIGGDGWAHWTVTQAVTRSRMALFDSSGRRYLLRASCTSGRPAKGRLTYVAATCVCFVSRKQA